MSPTEAERKLMTCAGISELMGLFKKEIYVKNSAAEYSCEAYRAGAEG